MTTDTQVVPSLSNATFFLNRWEVGGATASFRVFLIPFVIFRCYFVSLSVSHFSVSFLHDLIEYAPMSREQLQRISFGHEARDKLFLVNASCSCL